MNLSNNMKIAIIIDTLRSGGKERRLVELIKGLHREYQAKIALVLLSKEIHYEEILHMDIDIHYLERKWDKDPTIFNKFYKVCKNFKPEIIQSWDSMSSIYAAPVAKLLNVKFVNAMIYDAPYPFKPWSRKWTRSKITFPLSHAIIGNSQAGLEAYQAPKAKSHLIYNGYDFRRLDYPEPTEKLRTKFKIETENVVGMVATYSHHKDHPTLIQAAQKILEQRDDVTFLCVGGTKGAYKREAEALILDKNKTRVILADAQNPIEPVINLFTMGVLATYTEGISNAIMEYMAMAKPVVATDGGGTKELVRHKETGFLVKREDPEDLATRIVYLLDHPQEATIMGQVGQQRIKDTFNLSKMTSTFNTIYKKLLK